MDVGEAERTGGEPWFMVWLNAFADVASISEVSFPAVLLSHGMSTNPKKSTMDDPIRGKAQSKSPGVGRREIEELVKKVEAIMKSVARLWKDEQS